MLYRLWYDEKPQQIRCYVYSGKRSVDSSWHTQSGMFPPQGRRMPAVATGNSTNQERTHADTRWPWSFIVIYSSPFSKQWRLLMFLFSSLLSHDHCNGIHCLHLLRVGFNKSHLNWWYGSSLLHVCSWQPKCVSFNYSSIRKQSNSSLSLLLAITCEKS